MKRFILLFLAILLLCGCSALVPDSYLSVTPHVDSGSQTATTDAVSAENYLSLKNAILNLVRTGQNEGVIHVSNYDGDVEADLSEAAYEVSKLDPLGAYAVDYMTHSCTQIVSYYEIRVNITFRRTAGEIAQIQPTSTQLQLQERLQSALERYDGRLTLRLSSYRGQDQEIPALVADYCAAHPDTVMEIPTVSVSVYPETGSARILEINFAYTHTPEELRAMKDAIGESVHAAAEYVRYRDGDRDKAELLFTYLTERFQYVRRDTATPLYDALCGGVADPRGLSLAWQMICDRAGMECYTVDGMREGEPYTWNIISADGYYRHLDLSRCVLETEALTLSTDGEMTAYYWNTEQLPACDPIPLPAVQPETPPTEDPLLGSEIPEV